MNTAFKSFLLGQVLATPSVLEDVPPQRLIECLARHARGDWGDVCPEDARENDFSSHNDFRILSSYLIDPDQPNQGKFWIITEADRSATVALKPSEY